MGLGQIRFELQGGLEMADGLGSSSHFQECGPKIGMRLGHLGIEAHGFLEMPKRLWQPARS